MCPNPTAGVSGSNTVPQPGPPGCAEQPDGEQNGKYGHENENQSDHRKASHSVSTLSPT
jgi:hypothetical protein